MNSVKIKQKEVWMGGLFWFFALALFGWAIKLGVGRFNPLNSSSVATAVPAVSFASNDSELLIQVPDFKPDEDSRALYRSATLDTIIPTGNRKDAITYLVQQNDSVFGVAAKFNLKPETILWSNYALLQDNPHALSVGMELTIPPVDGIYYEWQEGDSFESVASQFRTDPESIINWIGNDLDLGNPQVEIGETVMIPGGKREFQQWLIPTIPRSAAGVSSGVYGSGVCTGAYDGVIGSGGFVWPTTSHTISGNDYWAGHLAIDIAVAIGGPVWAADHGVVVFAGWSTGGYGNVIMIDHGNGYQTLYAHLNSVSVGCGQSVSQGQVIGGGGSTGRSTGPHLHFEVRYLGGFINPWFVLP